MDTKPLGMGMVKGFHMQDPITQEHISISTKNINK